MHIYIYVYIYVYICTHVQVRICACKCMFVYICINGYIYLYIDIHDFYLWRLLCNVAGAWYSFRTSGSDSVIPTQFANTLRSLLHCDFWRLHVIRWFTYIYIYIYTYTYIYIHTIYDMIYIYMRIYIHWCIHTAPYIYTHMWAKF